MRKCLFVAFLGIWVAIVPFLPIQNGSTQTAVLFLSGIIIAAISIWMLRESSPRQ
jgi:hypothetical protein